VFAEECKGEYGMHWDNCHGTYAFSNGAKYVGEYKNGKKHGQGALTWLDGKKYTGEWKDGYMHGQGIYFYFYDGKFVGKFIGEFRDNKTYKGRMIGSDEKEINIDSKTPKIVGIWHITNNTGGISVFDRATFKRLIIFKDENLYKAVVMSYDWGVGDNYVDNIVKEYFDIESIDDLDLCNSKGWCWSDKGNFSYNKKYMKKDRDGYYHEHNEQEMVGREEYIKFLPTEYFEYKISDFDSEEHFISNMKKQTCTGSDDYSGCHYRIYTFHILTQSEIIDCMQKNKKEVLSKEQESLREENYNISNIPKIWSCIPRPSAAFFKKW